MKICYVAVDVALPHYRGASTHVYEVARHLVSLDNKVHVIARRVNKNEPREGELDKIRIHRVERGIFFSSRKSSFAKTDSKGSYRGATSPFFWKLYEMYLKTIFAFYVGLLCAMLIHREKVDVILERESSFGAGAIASLLTGKPLVLEVIGNRVTKLQTWRAKKIIAYSKSMFEGSSAVSKVSLVTAGVDVEKFKPDEGLGAETRNKYKLGDKPIVGFVGTFQEWHGIDEILQSSRLVLSSHPDTVFLMVGPYYNNALARAEEMGFSKSFIFTGAVTYDEVPAFLCASDILIAPYNPNKIASKEQSRVRQPLGSPIKLFEYMATGKPIVTTSVEPMTRIIDDHRTGLLVRAGDSDELGRSIVELLDDTKLRVNIGEEGRRLVVEKYTWLEVTKEMISIMQDSIGAKTDENS